MQPCLVSNSTACQPAPGLQYSSQEYGSCGVGVTLHHAVVCCKSQVNAHCQSYVTVSDKRRYIRHPGYLGFLLWCVGTQLLLVNPVSCITFTIVVR